MTALMELLAPLRFDACPKAPDGAHLPTVQEIGERDARGQLLEGTFRRVCLHCKQEVA